MGSNVCETLEQNAEYHNQLWSCYLLAVCYTMDAYADGAVALQQALPVCIGTTSCRTLRRSNSFSYLRLFICYVNSSVMCNAKILHIFFAALLEGHSRWLGRCRKYECCWSNQIIRGRITLFCIHRLNISLLHSYIIYPYFDMIVQDVK